MYQSERPKKNKILSGVFLLIAGLVAAVIGADYVWLQLGSVEITLQLAGIVFGIAGLIMLIVGIVEKKKEASEDLQSNKEV